MSFVITESMKGRLIEITVSGRLTKEVYAEFIPLAEEAIREYGKIRILFVMLGFQGWNASAMWEDLKFELKHFRDIERLAIVGETKWQKGMAMFCKPFTMAEVKYFEHGEFDDAREWLEEGLNVDGASADEIQEWELAGNA